MVGYGNDPKFLDRRDWANNVDPDQTALRSSLVSVYTVCHSVCIPRTTLLNIRTITASSKFTKSKMTKKMMEKIGSFLGNTLYVETFINMRKILCREI